MSAILKRNIPAAIIMMKTTPAVPIQCFVVKPWVKENWLPLSTSYAYKTHKNVLINFLKYFYIYLNYIDK